MNHRFIPALAAAVFFPASAYAHDLWIEKKGAEYVLQYGHRGGELMPIEAAKLKAVTCVDAKGAKSDFLPGASFQPKAVTFKGTCACLSAFYHGGFFSLTPDGEQNLPKNKVNDAVKSWESREFVKFVDAAAAGAQKPVGEQIEIVPVTNLTKLKEGDKATFKVLVDGAPVAGAAVARDHNPVGETGSAGEIRLKVKAAGLQVIDATVKKRIDSPEADNLVVTATIVFEVPR
ncbi:MAG: DUF4198 domain-containing protein [Deltaproteobacteria bacterium]|nr:DUF4198 domain-containing protein [Deltaproteobacteria bacterium]